MLERVSEDLWIVTQRQRLPGGVELGARMTVIRLPGGELWLHSPTPLDDRSAAAIDELGVVRHLVAPSRLHHLYLGDAQRRWPAATTWGAPGLAAKRPDLRFDEVLGEPATPRWGGVIEAVAIDGAPKVSETVFVHRPTGTLIVTDLLFSFPRAPNLATRLLLWMVGALGGLRQSRAWWIFTRDRAAAAASAGRILALPFDRVIPCHGEVVDHGGHPAVAAGLRWMLRGAPRAQLQPGSDLS
ncbi:MAG: DUF4336 domain-containing protein [Nannocystaceae bacterium]